MVVCAQPGRPAQPCRNAWGLRRAGPRNRAASGSPIRQKPNAAFVACKGRRFPSDRPGHIASVLRHTLAGLPRRRAPVHARNRRIGCCAFAGTQTEDTGHYVERLLRPVPPHHVCDLEIDETVRSSASFRAFSIATGKTSIEWCSRARPAIRRCDPRHRPPQAPEFRAPTNLGREKQVWPGAENLFRPIGLPTLATIGEFRHGHTLFRQVFAYDRLDRAGRGVNQKRLAALGYGRIRILQTMPGQSAYDSGSFADDAAPEILEQSGD